MSDSVENIANAIRVHPCRVAARSLCEAMVDVLGASDLEFDEIAFRRDCGCQNGSPTAGD